MPLPPIVYAYSRKFPLAFGGRSADGTRAVVNEQRWTGPAGPFGTASTLSDGTIVTVDYSLVGSVFPTPYVTTLCGDLACIVDSDGFSTSAVFPGIGKTMHALLAQGRVQQAISMLSDRWLLELERRGSVRYRGTEMQKIILLIALL